MLNIVSVIIILYLNIEIYTSPYFFIFFKKLFKIKCEIPEKSKKCDPHFKITTISLFYISLLFLSKCKRYIIGKEPKMKKNKNNNNNKKNVTKKK